MNLDFDQDLIRQLSWYEDNANINPDQQTIIYLIGLTTCAYCKRGLQWLREKGASFHWLYLDELDVDERQQIKEALSTVYKTRFSFPFVIFRNSRSRFCLQRI